MLTKTYAAQGMAKEQIGPLVDKWASYGLLTLQIGAFFGMLAASWVAGRLGRRRAFAIAFTTSMIATACAFHPTR